MVQLPRGPASTRGRIAIVLGGLLALGAVAFVLAYFVLFPTSSPKPFSLGSTTAASSTLGATAAKSSTSGSASREQISGRWTVASGSLAGYRVREKLGFLPALSDAVGRTSAVSGEARFARSSNTVTVSSASFRVAVNKLTSDRAQRDKKIHVIGLESDRFPTATFVLSQPLTLQASTLNGRLVHASATGILQLHGSSRQVTIPLEIKATSASFQAVGALTFAWGEFGMSAPSIGGFVNVTDKATMEFDLRLKHV